MKVLLGGKFNRLHPGHIYLFEKAKELADELVVIIAHDSHNKKECAEPAVDRKNMLEQVTLVDKVIIGEANNFAKVVKKERPDIIMLGYDQALPLGTEKTILENKIKIIKVEKYKDYNCSD